MDSSNAGGENGGIHAEGSGRLAPVVPLFAGRRSRGAGLPSPDGADAVADETDAGGPDRRPARVPEWRSTWDAEPGVPGSADQGGGSAGDGTATPSRAAFDRLLKKLHTRGLSASEARDALLAQGVDRATAEQYVADLEGRRWLNDADLAEQVVHAGVARKGEGRRAIARTLAKRGIPREVADAALAAVEDDDAERALEYARSKARGMAGLDRDTALRRLLGQLARRGYPGSVAMTAARLALDETGAGDSGVRFR